MKRTDWLQLSVHALFWVAVGFDAWPLLPILSFWNYAVLHNHMHVPVSPRGRFLLSRSIAFASGFPYRPYHQHHHNHHLFDDGPGDFGRARPHEGVLAYIARELFETWIYPIPSLRRLWPTCKTRQQRFEFVFDSVTHFAAAAALLYFRPSIFVGWILAQAGIFYLNLAAHYRSDSTRDDALAATSTSWFYNTFFFNAGYHQAHHLRPHVAWRALPALTEQLVQQGRASIIEPLSPIDPRFALQVARSRRKQEERALVAS